MLIQLDPTIPLETPKGRGYAHFLMDFGQEHFSLFGVFVDATGEFWWFQQWEVSLQSNITMGRPPNESR